MRRFFKINPVARGWGGNGEKLPGISGTLPTTSYYENALNPPTSANCSGGNGQKTRLNCVKHFSDFDA